MIDPRLLVWIAFGGAIGAVLRYLVGAVTMSGHFPYGTLIVNVTGSFLLALVVFHDIGGGNLSPHHRAFFGVGVLGAFTTMSTFSFETVALYTEGEPAKAGLNAALNLGLSLGAVITGRAIALIMTDGATT